MRGESHEVSLKGFVIGRAAKNPKADYLLQGLMGHAIKSWLEHLNIKEKVSFSERFDVLEDRIRKWRSAGASSNIIVIDGCGVGVGNVPKS